MKKYKVGDDYYYDDIYTEASVNGARRFECGAYEIGKYFLVIETTLKKTISFVLIGTDKGEGVYKCIYNDAEK